MNLTKITETSSTITLGWTPPNGVAGYAFFANGEIVSVASRNLKDGTPRKEAKFSKAAPGPPFQVAAICRQAGIFLVDAGTYPTSAPVVFPSDSLYPSEVAP